MANPHNIQPGQSVYFVHKERRSGEPHYVTVSKVGREWAYFNHSQSRFDLDTLAVEGAICRGSSDGQIYLSREAYEAVQTLRANWNAFRQYVDRCVHPPSGMTLERIRQLQVELFGEASNG